MKKKLYLAVVCALAAGMTLDVQALDDQDNKSEVKTQKSGKSKLWSYQPVKQPAIPSINNEEWAKTPIDTFILEQLEKKGLDPSPEADRSTLVRRIYLDVLGVIPTPEEVQAFVEDDSDDAYEQLVDRLLASPKYGERQGRKWLDLARYADSSGFQNDSDRLNMWRYRDYVINSFNQDKPYSRFIQEQLAGDELWPGDEQALIATGFMAQFPDNSNSRDLVQRRYQITTDITDTVGKVVLGQTVECARCHNHKFDKISQKDYFSLQSFFANISAVDNIPATKGEIEKDWDQQRAKYDEATKDIRSKIKAIVDTQRETALKYHKERYLTDSREAIFKPKDQWTPLDRWVNHRLTNVTTDRDLMTYFQYRGESTDPKSYDKKIAEQWDELEKLSKELKKWDDLKPATSSSSISAITELGYNDVPPTYVLAGGDHENPLEEVQPAFPAAITEEKPDIKPLNFSSGRRSALVKWLTSASNPLTPRVYVNRVWDQYFGRGIVETVSDFGKAGQKPSNPELLDYLASKFVNDGWSIKKLHKEILLSSVYRQSSEYREEVNQTDPENKLLALFPRQRLEAEQVRDSLLVAAGKLEDKIGGPSVYPPLPGAINVKYDVGNAVDNDPFWKTSKDSKDHNRRSLYIFTRRSIPYPILESFNMASPQEAHSKREITTSPLQALTLFNSEIIFDWSKALAGRIINEAGSDESDQIDRLYQILLARNPDEDEKEALQGFLEDQSKIIQEKTTSGKFEVNVPTGLNDNQLTNPLRAAAFVDLVHAVVNSNEVIYRF
ncbi:DUF1549 and DUF1553 domain-containing protein [Methylicorpusculum sp.]|uniref:DUF1549 and DUF1553 domain-containing protein n=1 Tax=Methylicorpusculum sp. TaxID=2713644 RepID=UPI0027360C75|nr:DUF1549 and DUF1553 domain-containing protein [Methylicorpusculum sp.]MDP3528573.1 DUF1549 and DUF1553 domain-containing protein [Methylicorpusculum sp.]MDZ4153413.1 DUF1549 and DUF1553 domain-containing protein [Methylicorpusculum sp.]